MATKKVIDMTARSSSALAYDDFLYLTGEAPDIDEKMQASVLRDYTLQGVKTSANSGLAQTSTPYATSNPDRELSLDVTNLTVTGGTASVTDYIAIDQGAGIKKLLVGDLPFASSASSVASLIGGTNVNVSAATGNVTVNLDTTLTALTSVTSTTFVGALTGNADTATTAATVTGATQAAITSAANLVTVGTIGTGVWEGTDIAAGYLADTAVTPGAYTAAAITIDQQGRITAASSGTPGDIDGVNAGTNLNGGGTTGTVTLNLDTTLTGLTSVTSTDFVGALTGNADTATALTGTLGVAGGGTGITTAAKGSVLAVNAIDTISALSGVTDGDVLTYTLATDTIGWATPTTGDVTEVQGTTPITITDGTGPVPIVSIDNTAVTPGTYNHATVTVDAKGRITGASSGTPGDLTAVLAGTGITVTNSTGPEPTVALTNTDVGYGGVTVALGASDATPAFDLVDSTNYEGSAVMSTGEVVTTKFLRTDGDNTSSWQIPPDTNTTYTAGDGLDLTGTTFSTDLKVNSGLVIDTTELSLDLSASSITGTLAVGDGGTGQTSYTNGQLLIGNTTGNTLAKATLTAGTNITITEGAGSITIAAAAGGDPAGTAVAMAIALGG